MYVCLAEFDIDEGSILKHQYPKATGADEHLLAELMLPDRAHSRSEDWTIFYLNQTPAVKVLSVRSEESGEKELEDGKLLYVLNLVRTKKDENVRRWAMSLYWGAVAAHGFLVNRGALVKALAICSPEPFVQIYKVGLCIGLCRARLMFVKNSPCFCWPWKIILITHQ